MKEKSSKNCLFNKKFQDKQAEGKKCIKKKKKEHLVTTDTNLGKNKTTQQ